MKTVEYLFHITTKQEILYELLHTGFKPSYARERFSEFSILVPVVSFSNILLRDVGEKEVLNYGDYGLCFTRKWGIRNAVHPVAYSYENGILERAVRDYFFYSLFTSNLERYKNALMEWTRLAKLQPKDFQAFSKHIAITNTPPEVMAILDYLSLDYTEEKANIFMNYAEGIRKATLPIIKLSKPYKVTNAAGIEFVAYNDREWRKIYDNLDFLVEGSSEYDKWRQTPKPHFNEPEYRINININDIKAIMLKTTEETIETISFLYQHFGENEIKALVESGSIAIGTKEQLIKVGF